MLFVCLCVFRERWCLLLLLLGIWIAVLVVDVTNVKQMTTSHGSSRQKKCKTQKFDRWIDKTDLTVSRSTMREREREIRWNRRPAFTAWKKE